MRILHFSDIHLLPVFRRVPLRDWLGKRIVGGLNMFVRRRPYFAAAAAKVVALDAFRRELEVDLVICTGDYTALGTLLELRTARAVVEPLMAAPSGYVTVPGNHDLYAPDVVRERRFQEAFGDKLTTDLPEFQVEGGPWPLVRLFGDDVAVVGVNSARPNRAPWLSSGTIPPAQLVVLPRILEDERVRSRFVFVMTHYAARLGDGTHDHPYHGLENADCFLAACASLPRGALLCGHLHRRFVVRIDGVRLPLFCAGSTTQKGREGLWVFDVTGENARATPGRWAGERYELELDSAIEL